MNLQFDPSDIDECNHVKQLLESGNMSSTLSEIYNICRSQLKHGDCENVDQLVALIEQIKGLASEYE
jgi:flagellin-specific chaperone FliS